MLLARDQPPPWVDDALPDDVAPLAPALARASVPPAGRSPTAHTALISQDTPKAPPSPPAGNAKPALAALQASALGDQWAQIIRPLAATGQVGAMVRELALQAQLLAVSAVDGGGRCWTLAVERETLRSAPLVAKLGAALQAALGEPVQLVVQAGLPQDSIARRAAQARDQAQREAEQIIHDDPAVQQLMAQFGTARIVPGSIKALTADPGEPRTP